MPIRDKNGFANSKELKPVTANTKRIITSCLLLFTFQRSFNFFIFFVVYERKLLKDKFKKSTDTLSAF
jgi:hypothetical protein